jgi:hypothetical protein
LLLDRRLWPQGKALPASAKLQKLLHGVLVGRLMLSHEQLVLQQAM